MGVVALMSACTSDPELTIITEANPDPVFEPAGSPGLDSFFPLEEQLELVAAETVGATGDAYESHERADTEQSGITDLTIGLPSDEAIKGGLYGGTAENTCDPERLIQYLLDNPAKGQVWADVQGIAFVDIPDYIRGLTPTVLTQPVTVLNHGFDPKGHAIPIVSTLAEGTAVLVDKNGDVRARCYCGNPILPYTPTTYMPPKCLSHYAVVYVAPNEREVVAAVSRSVNATKNIATYDQVRWAEISWGPDQTGWVRAHEAQARYCKPAEIISCVQSADVVSRPATTEMIGSVSSAHISVLTPDVQGWTLIKFGTKSGWIPTSALDADSCAYEVNCVAVSSGTWALPDNQGQLLVAPNTAQKLRLTGQTVVVNGNAFLQAYIVYPPPSRVGYVAAGDMTDLPDSDCEFEEICTPFDQDIPVYAESAGGTTVGWMWFVRTAALSGPTNGRYEVRWGSGTAWIDLGDLNTAVPIDCQPEIWCIEFLEDAYAPSPPNAGRITPPNGTLLATFTGEVFDIGGLTYLEIYVAGVSGPLWVETSVGYEVLDNSSCMPDPECDPESAAQQPCTIRCVAEVQREGWVAEALWTQPGYPLDLEFVWPLGRTASPLQFFGATSGATSWSPGPVAINGLVQMQWTNPITQQSGVIDCEINWCSLLPFDGDLGDIGDLIPDELNCLEEVVCQIDISDVQVPDTNSGATTVNVFWSPGSTPLDLFFDWSSSSLDTQQLQATGGAASSSHPGLRSVAITWFGPSGQAGTIYCSPCVDDVIYPDGAHICCKQGESELGDTGRCCPGADVALPDGSWCCPAEQFATRSCCPTTDLVVVSPEFCRPVEETTPTVTPVPPPVTPTATPTATPTVEPPPPTATATPTATPTPPVCPEGQVWSAAARECVRRVPPTPTPRPATPTPAAPTSTPTPVCELGVAPNGECVRYCNPGDLLTTRACVCTAAGTRTSADRVQCEIVCPNGQVNLTATQCGVPEVPTPVVEPTVETPRCDPPLRWNESLGGCTD